MYNLSGPFIPPFYDIIPGRVFGGHVTLAISFIFVMALNNASEAWDNAKKWIEAENFSGKGSDAHRAAVLGDTTGDLMKNTAGLSLNIIFKLMAVISLLLAPILVKYCGFI